MEPSLTVGLVPGVPATHDSATAAEANSSLTQKPRLLARGSHAIHFNLKVDSDFRGSR